MCLFPFCPQFKAFWVAPVMMNLAANAGNTKMQVQSLGQEDPVQ